MITRENFEIRTVLLDITEKMNFDIPSMIWRKNFKIRIVVLQAGTAVL